MKAVILCDFDGTIYRGDVYEDLLLKFGGSDAYELFEQYKRGEIRSQGVLESGWDTFHVSRGTLEAEMAGMEIDPDFPAFVSWCFEKGVKVGILSDGLDWYIRAVLANVGLENLPVFANQLQFEGEKAVFSYPYLDTSCPLCGDRFAVCKRNVILDFQHEGQKVIFIGDGSSDRCAAPAADLVIARRKLRIFCQQEKIPYLSFETFSDVLEQRTRILQAVEGSGELSTIIGEDNR
ncbi:MAG: MtnX-like HAD-IB family phosphatase [Anaerolineales bacterium]|nr:MtnX-like HAD-IB family phosphatase [Anaerolineales bacterium]